MILKRSQPQRVLLNNTEGSFLTLCPSLIDTMNTFSKMTIFNY